MRVGPSLAMTSTRHQVGLHVTSSVALVSTSVVRRCTRSRTCTGPVSPLPALTSHGQRDSAHCPASVRTVTSPPVSGTERSSVASALSGETASHSSRPLSITMSYSETKKITSPVSAVNRRGGPSPARSATHISVLEWPSAFAVDSAQASVSPSVTKPPNCGVRSNDSRRSSDSEPSAARRSSRWWVPSGLGAVPIEVRGSRNRAGLYAGPSDRAAGTSPTCAPGHAWASRTGPVGAGGGPS